MDKKDILENKIQDKEYLFINRLFFQARDLAIQNTLLTIEKEINEHFSNKYKIEVSFNSSSFYNPSIEVKLFNKHPKRSQWEFSLCSISLKREKINVGTENISDIYLTMERVIVSEYWRYKMPDYVKQFKEFFEAKYDSEYGKELVDNLNFPFKNKGLFPF